MIKMSPTTVLFDGKIPNNLNEIMKKRKGMFGG